MVEAIRSRTEDRRAEALSAGDGRCNRWSEMATKGAAVDRRWRSMRTPVGVTQTARLVEMGCRSAAGFIGVTTCRRQVVSLEQDERAESSSGELVRAPSTNRTSRSDTFVPMRSRAATRKAIPCRTRPLEALAQQGQMGQSAESKEVINRTQR